MAYPHGGAVQIWRDGTTEPRDPEKSEIRDWGLDVEGRIVAIEAAQTGTARYSRDTLADLAAIAGAASGDIAYVLDDPGNTGTYEFDGADWNYASALPPSLVNLSILREELDGKSDKGHGHKVADVAGLQAALDGIAASVSASVVAAAVGYPLFDSVSDGLAATDDGAGFSVFDGDSLSFYANAAGVEDLLGQVPLKAITDDLSSRITAVEDQAFAESPVYETTAAGIAATSEGDRFRVENADSDIAYDIYDHDSGGVATFVTDIPAGSALANKLTTSNALSELAAVAETARANIAAAAQSALTDTAGRINYVASNFGGTANARTCSLADGSVGGAPVTTTRGITVHGIVWPGTNTGDVTLAVNGGPALPLLDEDGNQLPPGALVSADRLSVFGTGTDWRLLGKGYRRIWDTRLRGQRLQTVNFTNPDAITATTADGTISARTRMQFFSGVIGAGTNSGGPVTIDIAGLGPQRLYEPDGSDPAAGRLAAFTNFFFLDIGGSYVIVAPAPAAANYSDQLAALSRPKTLGERLAVTAPMASVYAQAARAPIAPPEGISWNHDLMPLVAAMVNGRYTVVVNPREMVDSRIWTEGDYFVDGTNGDDANDGTGDYEGDFSRAKRTVHSAYTAGNAAGKPYKIWVMAGDIGASSFSNNGTVEPTQPVALLAYGGRVRYRTGSFTYSWTLDEGTTYQTTETSVNRVFRTDVLTGERGDIYTELTLAADLATCRATPGTWFKDGSTIYVNLGTAPGASDVALIRNFHGARFLTHAEDFYMEGFDIEGGITGAFHADPQADRNIVCVDCTFRYSSPSNVTNQQDAFRVRRTNGLVLLVNCDASGGAKDNWNFHGDSYPQMYVCMLGCTGELAGWNGATSCNALTTHDEVILVDIGGRYRSNAPGGTGTTVHCIEETKTWTLGTVAIDEDLDGDGGATAFKCSNDAVMYLQATTADASGGASTNYAIEANGGQVFKRDHVSQAGTEVVSGGGSIGSF